MGENAIAVTCARVSRLAAVCFLAFCITACSGTLPRSTNSPSENVRAQRTHLENEKLALEIERLRQEQTYYALTRWAPVFTGFFGGLAVLWTIYQGYRTLRYQSDTQNNQTVSQESSRVAELLSFLSDPEEDKRLGAARSLTRYVDSVIPEVLSALSHEPVWRVRKALEEVLANVSDKSLGSVFASNASTVPDRSLLAGRLAKADATPPFARAVLRLSTFSMTALRKDFSGSYDQGKRLQAYEVHRAKVLQGSEGEVNQQVIDECRRTVLLAESTGRVVAQYLRDDRKPTYLGRALDLTSTELHRADLSHLDLESSLMVNCVMRHAVLNYSKLAKCDFDGSDLLGVSVDKADLSETNLTNAQIRSSSGSNANFREAKLQNTVISQSDLPHANLERAQARKAKFKGAKLHDALFQGGFFDGADFSGAELQNAVFDNASCQGATFIGSTVVGARMVGTKLKGANLRGVIFDNVDLTDADLSGADVAGADFRGAITVGMTLDNARNANDAQWNVRTE